MEAQKLNMANAAAIQRQETIAKAAEATMEASVNETADQQETQADGSIVQGAGDAAAEGTEPGVEASEEGKLKRVKWKRYTV